MVGNVGCDEQCSLGAHGTSDLAGVVGGTRKGRRGGAYGHWRFGLEDEAEPTSPARLAVSARANIHNALCISAHRQIRTPWARCNVVCARADIVRKRHLHVDLSLHFTASAAAETCALP